MHARGPYEIAYGSLVPKRSECPNLLVPVCVSSSHIAFGSIRMEPVFMILAQSAATAAVLALDGNLPVQDLPYPDLRAKLEADGQILHHTPSPADAGNARPGLDPKTLPGIVVDDENAVLTDLWEPSRAAASFVGQGYRHDGKHRSGTASARFEAVVPKAANYEVRLFWPPNANRASNVPVTIEHASGKETRHLNQRIAPSPERPFAVLGQFPFAPDSPAAVIIRNEGADGYVVIDAVQWVEAP